MKISAPGLQVKKQAVVQATQEDKMAGEVCKVFIVRRLKEAGYALSAEGRSAHLAKGGAALKESGGRSLIVATSRWSTYDTNIFGAELFPNMDAVQKYSDMLEKLNWFQFIEGETFLGTPLNVSEPAADGAIYALQLIHGARGAAAAISEAQVNQRLADVAGHADSLGVRRILQMNPRWSHEELMHIQILEWPSLEALMKQVAYEEEMEWLRYVSQRQILGSRIQ
jgi:hypothetical protein